MSVILQNIFGFEGNKDPIFYFLGFRRCGARDNGMKLLNFRYLKRCSSRLILGQETIVPLAIMRGRPIGVMKMIDQGEADDKIIAIHIDDPEFEDYHSISDLPAHRMREVRHFLRIIKFWRVRRSNSRIFSIEKKLTK